MGYLNCVISYPIGYHFLPGEDGHPPARDQQYRVGNVKFRSFTSDSSPIPPRARVSNQSLPRAHPSLYLENNDLYEGVASRSVMVRDGFWSFTLA